MKQIKKEIAEDVGYEISYKSKLLNKEFSNLDDLLAAEKTYKEANAVKLAKSQEKKAQADKVTALIQAEYEAFKSASEAIKLAKEEYLNKINEAEKTYNAAKAAKNKALTDFIAKYPEGFHTTIKSVDGNETTDISYSDKCDFKTLLNTISDLFRF
jgi:hypothetical protein